MISNPSRSLDRILDEVLRRQLVGWARRALAERKAAAEPDAVPHLLYVDAFAGSGYRLGVAEDGGSPVHRVQALHALCSGAAVPLSTVLVEEDPANVERLLDRLRAAGIDAELQEEPRYPEPGSTVVLPGRWEAVAPALRAPTDARALYLLDPPSAERLPREEMEALLECETAEILLLFPGEGLRRQARFRGPLADLPPYAKRIVEGYARFFGDARHEWVARWRAVDETEGVEAAEVALADHYRHTLTEAHPSAVWKRVRLSEGSGEAARHLLFASRDPRRALELNELLYAVRQEGQMLAETVGSGVVREEEVGALELFPFGGVEARPALAREVDLPTLAHELATHFLGRTVSLRQLLVHLADSDLFWEDVRRALGALRRDGRVLYRSLSRVEEPVAFPRGRSAIARGKRRPDGDSLSLLPDPE